MTLAEFIDTAKLDLDGFEKWAEKITPLSVPENWWILFGEYRRLESLPEIPGYQESEGKD